MKGLSVPCKVDVPATLKIFLRVLEAGIEKLKYNRLLGGACKSNAVDILLCLLESPQPRSSREEKDSTVNRHPTTHRGKRKPYSYATLPQDAVAKEPPHRTHMDLFAMQSSRAFSRVSFSSFFTRYSTPPLLLSAGSRPYKIVAHVSDIVFRPNSQIFPQK